MSMPPVLARVEIADRLDIAESLRAEIQAGGSPVSPPAAGLGGFVLRLDGLAPAELQWFANLLPAPAVVTGSGPLGPALLAAGSPSLLVDVCQQFLQNLPGARRAAWQDALGAPMEFLAGRRPHSWRIRDRVLSMKSRTLIMGILNVTPDSFSDGGRYLDPALAVDHALEMAAAGADIIDVGGESTRPGSVPVDAGEEWRRLAPVLERLLPQLGVPISVDTYKAETARRALELGVQIINDVSGLGDPAMAATVARAKAGLVVMHNAEKSQYQDLVTEVAWFLRKRLLAARQAGIPDELVVLDPGLGFGKHARHNFVLMKRLPAIVSLGRPVLVGPSRKRMIGRVLGTGPQERLEGTMALAALSAWMGAGIVRVHDVAAIARVTRMIDAIQDPTWGVAEDGG